MAGQWNPQLPPTPTPSSVFALKTIPQTKLPGASFPHGGGQANVNLPPIPIRMGEAERGSQQRCSLRTSEKTLRTSKLYFQSISLDVFLQLIHRYFTRKNVYAFSDNIHLEMLYNHCGLTLRQHYKAPHFSRLIYNMFLVYFIFLDLTIIQAFLINPSYQIVQINLN